MVYGTYRKGKRGFSHAKNRTRKGKNFKKAKFNGDTMQEIGDLASKAWQGIKYVKNLINVEQNYFIVTTGAVECADSGYISTHSLMATGDGTQQRTGYSIKPTYFEFSHYMLAQIDVTTVYRVILFRDKQCDGSQPNVTDVLNTASPQSHLNHENLNRFTVLGDWLYVIAGNGSTSKQAKIISFDKKIGGHIEYDGTGATSGNMKAGQIFCLSISDKATGSTAPTMTITSKLTYTDN